MNSFAFSLIHQYGASAAFILLALEYIGLPIPGEPIMSMLGFITSNNLFAFITSVLLCIGGTFTGSMVAFVIGLKFGEPVIETICKPFHVSQDKLNILKATFIKNQAALIIFSRFIPGFRHIIPYLSGSVQIQFRKYITLNLVSSVIWCGFFLFSGYFLKNLWHNFDTLTRIISLIVLAVIIIIYITVKLVKRHKRKI